MDYGRGRNGFWVLDGELKDGLVVSCASAAFCALEMAWCVVAACRQIVTSEGWSPDRPIH